VTSIYCERQQLTMSATSKPKLLWGKPKNYPHSTEEEKALLPWRKVEVGRDQNYEYINNGIKTSKYEPWNFVFLFLLEEFNPYTKVANLYFLCIACLQMVKPISNTNGVPTFLIPLSIVVGIDALFHALEDYARHRADHVANITPAVVFVKNADGAGGEFKEVPRFSIAVGDIIRIDNRREIPADCLIISVQEKTEPAQGLCFVETKQLDGETNLKSRSALPSTLATIRTEAALASLVGQVEMEHPNNLVDSFMGKVILANNSFFEKGAEAFKATSVIQPSNILLRGCVLRNTDFVYAIVLNTGHDTKIMMSAQGARPKSSALEQNASGEIEKIIAMLLCFCFIGAIGQTVWNKEHDLSKIWYLGYHTTNATGNFFVSLGYFFLLHASCIPVSLYVSMTIIRGGQMYFMNKDLDMYYAKTDTPALVRTMQLNEELGQISHVFSDKTGTLTCNIMDFRKMSVNGISYGIGITEIGKASWKLQGREIPQAVLDGELKAKAASVPHVSFYCPDYVREMDSKNSKERKNLQNFFRILSMCHDVIPEHADGTVKLSASNPDDECLVQAAQYFGFEFTDRQEGKIVISSKDDGNQTPELLETIKFTSKRKRMSVVIRDTDKKVKLLIKGADTAIVGRVKAGQEALLKTTIAHMEQYSVEGLRCLLLGHKDLSDAEWNAWNNKYQKAAADLEQLDLLKKGLPNQIEELEEQLEKDITLVGSTAIEDKLQDGVPECIAQLAAAGINLWVLTGDKEETAINIAVACNLVLPQQYMDHIIINQKTAPTRELMTDILKNQLDAVANEDRKTAKPKALIIDGPSLIICLQAESKTRSMLLELSKSCRAVVGCRVSPDQKRQMVDLIKKGIPTVRTLAIGDGANDVAMIQEAHIGIGIKGEEGLQAVNSSDYAIAQFRYLEHLLLKHGRYNYIRMSNLVCYVFYKNVMGSIAMFWFNTKCGFSGQKIYAEGAIQMFNLLFTSIPILFYGVYDRDVPIEMVRKFPKMYNEGVTNKYFNTKVFWSWVGTALWQTPILCLVPFGFYEQNGDHGRSPSFWAAGALSYTALIYVVNMKLFSFQSCWAWGNYAVIVFSICLWWLFAATLTLNMDLSQFDWYHVFSMAAFDGSFWLGLWFLVTLFTLYECTLHGFWRSFFWTNDHILQEVRAVKEVSSTQSKLQNSVSVDADDDPETEMTLLNVTANQNPV